MRQEPTKERIYKLVIRLCWKQTKRYKARTQGNAIQYKDAIQGKAMQGRKAMHQYK